MTANVLAMVAGNVGIGVGGVGSAGRGVPRGVQLVLLKVALRCAQAAARVASAAGAAAAMGAGVSEASGTYGASGGAGGVGGVGVGHAGVAGVAGASACAEASLELFQASCAALHVVSGPTLGEGAIKPARQVFAQLETACAHRRPDPHYSTPYYSTAF
jgi:hypothetical protein